MGMNQGVRVLVVDDDHNILDFVDMALSYEGYDVITAEDGEAAIDLVDRSNPELILLDMHMPVMDGWEFSQRYNKVPGPHAPIIVLTAAMDAASAAKDIQADGFLGKPFDLGELLEMVKTQTHRD
jgi:DNA-binding response OmpR family regulator